MASLLTELKRRNVFRVAFAYIVVGWVVLQVAEFLSPLLQLPPWTVSFALYLGVIGFPFALLFAWAFELTPEGLRRTQDVDPDASITRETASKLNRMSITLMGIAIVLLLSERVINRPGENTGTPASESAATSVEAGLENSNQGPTAKAALDKPKSIAVLPFVNMSNDPEQDYFSDGISEELLNALANIRDLRVAARTSSFAFKGQNTDITAIGEQLKVATVLEGSVRKSGQRLRITAQLINVNDGYHLWSETYDRDLIDIFAIQDEISAAIVDALKVHLSGGEVATSDKAVSLEAYNFYLLGRHSLRQRQEASLQMAIKEFQKAIDIEPTYAEAWVGKATATSLLSVDNYGSLPISEANQSAQAMLDVAFSLDPNSAWAHATQSLLYSALDLPREALASVNRAIELNPNEGILYSWRFNALSDLGDYNAAMASLEKAYQVDPLHRTIRQNLVLQYGLNGEVAKARELVTTDSVMAFELEAHVDNAAGRWAESVLELRKGRELEGDKPDTRLDFWLSLNYFFSLKNTELALEFAGPRIRKIYSAILAPEAYLASNSERDLEAKDLVALSARVIALDLTGRCPQMLALLKDKQFETTALYGRIDGAASYARLALHYAACLRATGEQGQARAIAERLLDLVETSIANGQQPDYFDFLARIQMLLDDEDAAIGTLRMGLQYYYLSWADLSRPDFDPLRERDDFQQIQQALEDHMNRERAKLDWEPIEL